LEHFLMAATEAVRAVNLQTPRVAKCPTPQCPGWITLDSTRHQTEPCRYCRVGVDTLRYLLSRVGAEHKALPPEVHDEFNRLMLTMAGAWGRNVYLRPSHRTLVDLLPGARGVTLEYNPLLGAAGSDGVAPLVGTILHKLLHFEAHLGERVPQLSARSGAKEKEGLLPMLNYLLTVADHAWVTARLQELYPELYSAQARWGLDISHMLIGSESMFNRYLSERNLNKMLDILGEVGDDSAAFRAAIVARLSTLTAQILEREKEEPRRVYLAIQLANTRLLNEATYDEYLKALTDSGLPSVREAAPLADKLYDELNTVVAQGQGKTVIDSAQFAHALQGAIKSLGLTNFFDVKA